MNQISNYKVAVTASFFLVAIFGFAWGLNVWNIKKSVGSLWVENNQAAESRVPLRHLTRAVGFDGLIYNFRNYLLRQDDAYRVAAIAAARVAEREAAVLRSRLELEAELSALNQIMALVRQYEVTLSLAERLISEGVSSGEINQLGAVSDAPVFQALDTLSRSIHARNEASSTQISEALETLNRATYSGALLTIPMLLLSCLIVVIFRCLDRSLKALRESNSEIELLLETTPDAVLSVGEDGTILRVNQAAAEYFGYGHRLKGMKVESLMPESIRSYHVKERLGFFENPTPREMAPARRVQAVLAKGEVRDVSIMLGFFHSRNGPQAVVSVRDVTEENRFRSTLIDFQNRMDFAASIARFGIWELISGGDTLFWDKWTYALHGTTADTFVPSYRNWLTKVHPEDQGYVDAEIQRSISDAEEVDIEYRVILENGNTRYIRLAVGIQATSDTEYRMTGTCTDVTAARTAQRFTELARSQAEKANEAKGQFLANISHEIRTPVNAVMGILTLLDNSSADQRQKRLISTAYASAESLLLMLNDVLDFSKLEANKIRILNRSLKLHRVIEKVTDLFRPLATNKGISLRLTVDRIAYSDLIGDELRLTQVLGNLMSNAIKFTRVGSVTLSVRGIDVTNEDCTLRFCIQDTGEGMTQEQLVRSLEPFNQADMTTTRTHGGTGLGLPICNSLLGLMGSRLAFDSEPGEGTSVSFDLRFGIPESVQRLTDNPLHGRGALLVVQDLSLRETVVEYLESWGMVVDSCPVPSDFLAVAMSADQPFDYLITDMSVEDESGALQELRARWVGLYPNLKDHIVLLRSDRRAPAARYDFSGEDFTIVKSPPTPARLFDILRTQSRVTEGVGTSPGDRVHEAVLIAEKFRGGKVLVVEDVDTNRMIVCDFLRTLGMSADVAVNGEEALEKLSQSRFDVVLMDLHMPVMNGVDATLKIRENPEFDELPVIAMTAASMVSGALDELPEGMQCCVSKPVDILTLTEVLVQFLPPSDLTGLTVEAVEPDISSGDHNLGALPIPKSFDMTFVAQNFSGNSGLFIRCLSAFQNDFREWGHEYASAAGKDDAEAMSKLSHKLKGAAENIGARELSALGRQLESDRRSGDTGRLAQNLELFVKLMDEIESISKDGEVQDPYNEEAASSEEIGELITQLRSGLDESRYIPIDVLDTWLTKLPANIPHDLLMSLRGQIESFDYAGARTNLERIERLAVSEP